MESTSSEGQLSSEYDDASIPFAGHQVKDLTALLKQDEIKAREYRKKNGITKFTPQEIYSPESEKNHSIKTVSKSFIENLNSNRAFIKLAHSFDTIREKRMVIEQATRNSLDLVEKMVPEINKAQKNAEEAEALLQNAEVKGRNRITAAEQAPLASAIIRSRKQFLPSDARREHEANIMRVKAEVEASIQTGQQNLNQAEADLMMLQKTFKDLKEEYKIKKNNASLSINEEELVAMQLRHFMIAEAKKKNIPESDVRSTPLYREAEKSATYLYSHDHSTSLDRSLLKKINTPLTKSPPPPTERTSLLDPNRQKEIPEEEIISKKF